MTTKLTDEQMDEINVKLKKLQEYTTREADLKRREASADALEKVQKQTGADLSRREEIVRNVEAAQAKTQDALKGREDSLAQLVKQLEEREKVASDRETALAGRETKLREDTEKFEDEKDEVRTTREGLRARERTVAEREQNVEGIVAKRLEAHKAQLDAEHAERKRNEQAEHDKKMVELNKLTRQWNAWGAQERKKLEEEARKMSGWQNQLNECEVMLNERLKRIEWMESRIHALQDELKKGMEAEGSHTDAQSEVISAVLRNTGDVEVQPDAANTEVEAGLNASSAGAETSTEGEATEAGGEAEAGTDAEGEEGTEESADAGAETEGDSDAEAEGNAEPAPEGNTSQAEPNQQPKGRVIRLKTPG